MSATWAEDGMEFDDFTLRLTVEAVLLEEEATAGPTRGQKNFRTRETPRIRPFDGARAGVGYSLDKGSAGRR